MKTPTLYSLFIACFIGFFFGINASACTPEGKKAEGEWDILTGAFDLVFYKAREREHEEEILGTFRRVKDLGSGFFWVSSGDNHVYYAGLKDCPFEERQSYEIKQDYEECFIHYSEEVHKGRSAQENVRNGNYYSARDVFLSMAHDYPGEPKIMGWLGYITAVLEDDKRKALAYYEKGLISQPKNANLCAAKAIVHYSLGEREKAAEEKRKSLKLDKSESFLYAEEVRLLKDHLGVDYSKIDP